jgi:hypothetical protein
MYNSKQRARNEKSASQWITVEQSELRKLWRVKERKKERGEK